MNNYRTSFSIKKFIRAMAAVATSNAITLKGSVEIVSEFFGFAVNSILYQRGVYPPEKFIRTQVDSIVLKRLMSESSSQKYGLPMMVTGDSQLQSYISSNLDQLKGLHANSVTHTHAWEQIACFVGKLWSDSIGRTHIHWHSVCLAISGKIQAR